MAHRKRNGSHGWSNLQERDRYWGLLIDGFENRPIYANPYQPPYYQKLFEDYGFKTFLSSICILEKFLMKFPKNIKKDRKEY